MLTYKWTTFELCKSAVVAMLNPCSFESLRDFQRCLFYSFLAYNYEDLYSQSPLGEEFLMTVLEEMSYGVSVFAMDFLAQAKLEKLSDEFFHAFLTRFRSLRDCNEKWVMLQKIM